MDPGMHREKETDGLLLSGWRSPASMGQTLSMPESVLMLWVAVVPLKLMEVPACTGWTWSHRCHHPKPLCGSQAAIWDVQGYYRRAEVTGSSQGHVPGAAQAGHNAL